MASSLEVVIWVASRLRNQTRSLRQPTFHARLETRGGCSEREVFTPRGRASLSTPDAFFLPRTNPYPIISVTLQTDATGLKSELRGGAGHMDGGKKQLALDNPSVVPFLPVMPEERL